MGELELSKNVNKQVKKLALTKPKMRRKSSKSPHPLSSQWKKNEIWSGIVKKSAGKLFRENMNKKQCEKGKFKSKDTKRKTKYF